MNPSELVALAPEIFLAIMGMFLLLAGCFMGNRATLSINVATGITFFITIAGVLFLSSFGNVLSAGNYNLSLLGGHVGVDGFTALIKVLLLGASLAALLLSHNELKAALARPEYPVLILFATLGMMLMVSSRSLLGLYVGLELQSLTLYVLAAIQRDNARSSEAGLKYFVLGALASGLLLYGISLIYGATGTIFFDKLHALLAGKPPVEVILGFVMILAALAFKVSAAPFHMWTPDVYEGAPTPVTAFFAAAPKLAGIALLVKVLSVPFAGLGFQAQQIIVVLAFLSMGWGAFAAIAQSNIKRLMAYSSIGHVGFALLGLLQGGEQGVTATLVYLLIYLPMTLGSFAIILSLRRDGKHLDQLSDLAGFSKTRPVLAAIMTLIMFSMMGIPPLAGFFGKLYVFMAAVDAGFVWLAVAGVIFSVIGGFYYLRVIKIMYFDKAEGGFDAMPGSATGFVLTCSSLFILGFILAPSCVTEWVRAAAQALFA